MEAGPGRGKVKNRMLTREGGRDAALRFQMDAESCEPAGAGRRQGASRWRGADLGAAERRVLGSRGSCSGEGGSQMGGGETTREHRKVEAGGGGGGGCWESAPAPRPRA